MGSNPILPSIRLLQGAEMIYLLRQPERRHRRARTPGGYGTVSQMVESGEDIAPITPVRFRSVSQAAGTLRSHGISLSYKQLTAGKDRPPVEPCPAVICRCSSMAEHQSSKLVTRVQFPSPAPWALPRHNFSTILRKGENNGSTFDPRVSASKAAQISRNGSPDIYINLTSAAGSDSLVHKRVSVALRVSTALITIQSIL